MDIDPATDVELLLADDFTAGLAAGRAEDPWRLRPVPGLPHGDGLAVTGPAGLVVTSSGTNPETGEPAFVRPDAPLNEGDHLRWALFANRDTPEGMPGYSLAKGENLTLTATLGVEVFGLDRHTYGGAVPEPGRDLRLGAAAMICMDRRTGMVFDFITTQECVFAVYERLAWPGTGYAGFSYAVPVLDRSPGDRHTLSIGYDRSAGAVRWLVGDKEVLQVDALGHRLPESRYALRDNGLEPAVADPHQVTCGLALFTERIYGQGVRLTVTDVAVRRGRISPPSP